MQRNITEVEHWPPLFPRKDFLSAGQVSFKYLCWFSELTTLSTIKYKMNQDYTGEWTTVTKHGDVKVLNHYPPCLEQNIGKSLGCPCTKYPVWYYLQTSKIYDIQGLIWNTLSKTQTRVCLTTLQVLDYAIHKYHKAIKLYINWCTSRTKGLCFPKWVLVLFAKQASVPIGGVVSTTTSPLPCNHAKWWGLKL